MRKVLQGLIESAALRSSQINRKVRRPPESLLVYPAEAINLPPLRCLIGGRNSKSEEGMEM